MSDEQSSEVKRLQAKAGGMLPGVAAICLFLLVLTMINAFAALHGNYGAGRSKYGILALCTLMAAGIFGLLRMRRWGWALVLGGCLTLAMGDLTLFARTHIGPFLLQGLFSLLFFLYLVRTEVRDRLR